jgi:hypothetical protein
MMMMTGRIGRGTNEMTYLVDHSIYLDHIDIMQVGKLCRVFDPVGTRQLHTVDLWIIWVRSVDEKLSWSLGC